MIKSTSNSPEELYTDFTELANQVAIAFKRLDISGLENLKFSNASEVEKWASAYRGRFTSSLKFILTTIGLKFETYNHNFGGQIAMENICDLDSIVRELNKERELYISRIRNLTTYEPDASVAAWTNDFRTFKTHAAWVIKEAGSLSLMIKTSDRGKK